MQKFARAIIASVVASVGMIGFPGTSIAQSQDCSTSNPPFPGYDSAQIERNIPINNPLIADTIPLRTGFYCKPSWIPDGDLVNESIYGFGFGYDKVRHRHNISSRNAIQFAFSDKKPSSRYDSDIGGNVWEFHTWARARDCSTQPCELLNEQKVVGIATTVVRDTYYNMPARIDDSDSKPVGVMTVYCDYGEPAELRCEDWVNTALKNGAEKGPGS